MILAKLAGAGLLALVAATATTAAAAAATIYDGGWSLTFFTQRGACDASYNFVVQITNGLVSHPNLVKFKGRVTPAGVVRASVSVPGKFAAGSGRIRGKSGKGRWAGHSGKERCSGYWSAQKN